MRSLMPAFTYDALEGAPCRPGRTAAWHVCTVLFDATLTSRSAVGWRPPVSLDAHLQDCERFFDGYASIVDTRHRRNRGYHRAVSSLAQFNVPADASVLGNRVRDREPACGAAPCRGLGVDVSGEMVRLAKKKHPNLEFRHVAAEHLDLNAEHFDYIILSDVIGFLFGISGWSLSERAPLVVRTLTLSSIGYSRLWQPVLAAAE